MRIFCLLTLVVVSISAVSDQDLFTEFLTKYRSGVTYTRIEYDKRFNIFKSNLRKIKDLNQSGKMWTSGITKFMDLSPGEFKFIFNNLKRQKLNNKPHLSTSCSVSDIDWSDSSRQKVTDQFIDSGSCGGSPMIAVADASDSIHCIANNLNCTSFIRSSPQQLIDCDTGNSGCNGGDPLTIYDYVINIGGLENISKYPFKGSDGTCAFDAKQIKVKIDSYQTVTANDESDLSCALMNQPVVVCVDVDPLQYYTGGIISRSCINGPGYCALAVGLTTGSNAYYKVKASFSDESKTFWGEHGYFRVARNMTTTQGGSGSMCISAHASYPTT
jgi:cathepsin L